MSVEDSEKNKRIVYNVLMSLIISIFITGLIVLIIYVFFRKVLEHKNKNYGIALIYTLCFVLIYKQFETNEKFVTDYVVATPSCDTGYSYNVLSSNCYGFKNGNLDYKDAICPTDYKQIENLCYKCNETNLVVNDLTKKCVAKDTLINMTSKAYCPNPSYPILRGTDLFGYWCDEPYRLDFWNIKRIPATCPSKNYEEHTNTYNKYCYKCADNNYKVDITGSSGSKNFLGCKPKIV